MPQPRPAPVTAPRAGARAACACALAGALAAGCASGSPLRLTVRDATTHAPAAGLDVLVIDQRPVHPLDIYSQVFWPEPVLMRVTTGADGSARLPGAVSAPLAIRAVRPDGTTAEWFFLRHPAAEYAGTWVPSEPTVGRPSALEMSFARP
ncbi:MAG: hypothetical protein C0475_01785 [Planctomyces sp.]|nr:hypothetical protein [Planctomyces sp.]